MRQSSDEEEQQQCQPTPSLDHAASRLVKNLLACIIPDDQSNNDCDDGHNGKDPTGDPEDWDGGGRRSRRPLSLHRRLTRDGRNGFRTVRLTTVAGATRRSRLQGKASHHEPFTWALQQYENIILYHHSTIQHNLLRINLF